MESPVVYLEEEDINPSSGRLQVPFSVPVMIMVQSNGCGHCTMAKPKYQRAAQVDESRPGGPSALWATIQMDHPSSRKALQAMIKSGLITESLIAGVPTYFVIMPDNSVVEYSGDRSSENLLAFTDSLLQK